MQFVPGVQLACMRVTNPLAARAFKAASELDNNSRERLHWRKRGWTEVPPLPPHKNLPFCVT